MSKKIRENYEQYCKDKRAIEEVPLPYINWLELEVQAWMEQDEERRKYHLPYDMDSIKSKNYQDGL